MPIVVDVRGALRTDATGAVALDLGRSAFSGSQTKDGFFARSTQQFAAGEAEMRIKAHRHRLPIAQDDGLYGCRVRTEMTIGGQFMGVVDWTGDAAIIVIQGPNSYRFTSCQWTWRRNAALRQDRDFIRWTSKYVNQGNEGSRRLGSGRFPAFLMAVGRITDRANRTRRTRMECSKDRCVASGVDETVLVVSSKACRQFASSSARRAATPSHERWCRGGTDSWMGADDWRIRGNRVNHQISMSFEDARGERPEARSLQSLALTVQQLHEHYRSEPAGHRRRP